MAYISHLSSQHIWAVVAHIIYLLVVVATHIWAAKTTDLSLVFNWISAMAPGLLRY